MADQNYIIELADGRELSFKPQDVQHYPTIKNTIDSPLFDPDSTILLTYDPDVLFKIFTTPILQQNHTLDMYVKITNGMDYLENIATVKQMMATLVKWFDNPDIVAQFKINKENTKNLIHSLNFEPQGWFLDSTLYLKLNYMLNAPIHGIPDGYHVAVSDDLSYVLIWDLPIRAFLKSSQVNIYKDGTLIKTANNLPLHQVSTKMVIDDNGNIYNNRENNVYIWSYPEYIPQFYKHIDGEAIVLSNNTQRYLQIVQEILNIGGFDQSVETYIISDLHTGTVLSRTIPYNPAYPPRVIEVRGPYIISSPHMDLIIIKNDYRTIGVRDMAKGSKGTNHGVWVVDKNTTNWIEFPRSEILLISHSEQIIATANPQPEDTKKYNVSLYKRQGVNFEPLANIDGINGRPIVVNEDFLLTMEPGGMSKQGTTFTININFHKITNQTIDIKPTFIIKADMLDFRDIRRVLPGPQKTFIFISGPTVQESRYIIKKYGIQPYDTMEEFLEDKLD